VVFGFLLNLRTMLGFLTGCGGGLGAESGRGLRGGLTPPVGGSIGCGMSCGAGDPEELNCPEIGRGGAGEAEGCFGAGELLAELDEDFALADTGFGGDRRIASSLELSIVSLMIFLGRCPSALVELEALSGG